MAAAPTSSVHQYGKKDILRLLPVNVYGRRISFCGIEKKSQYSKSQQQMYRGLCLRPMAMAATTADLDGREDGTVNPTTTALKSHHRPSKWRAISFSFDNQVQERYGEAVEALKEDVRAMIIAKYGKPREQMILIDTLERLGVAYHFKHEIEEQIEQIFKSHAKDGSDSDLFTTALYFRLCRQHGYDINSGIFGRFKGKDGKFEKALTSDVDGLLNLYEASYLRYHGEDILEEATVFTTHYLNEAKPQILDPYLQAKVTRALKQPLHRGVEKLESRYYISIYEKNESRNELLLKLAKLDFNILQNLYKQELSELFKWWKELDLTTKLPYVRDRVAECFFWGMSANFEPEYSFSRVAVAKAIVMITVLNDTYENVSTLKELEIFPEIVQRWDTKDNDQLPTYMKIAYEFLMSVYEDHDSRVSKQGRSYAVPYAIKTMIQLAKAYHMKAKWYTGEVIPTFQDHESNGAVLSTIYVLLSSYYIGTESALEETFVWLINRPKIVDAVGLLGRYVNDIGTYERECEGGQQSTTAIDCYMRENGASKEETLHKFVEFSEGTWMTINKEWVTASCVPRDIMKPVLNIGRVGDTTYKSGTDGYSSPESGLEQDIFALFLKPIDI
uniref:8,9-dihydroserrulat-14-ene synthase 22 n=1 Tax=Eremophila drummondii TaxID=2652523 RepID=A0A6G9KSU3_9LAMI|nr:8,9-dihydroserrulat-14-ene synthase 22 [Eremophila drummondii]